MATFMDLLKRHNSLVTHRALKLDEEDLLLDDVLCPWDNCTACSCGAHLEGLDVLLLGHWLPPPPCSPSLPWHAFKVSPF